jgi:hypothetical protein
VKPPRRCAMEESGREGAKGRGANIPALRIRNLLQRASAALERRAFVRRAPENGHQALCRRTQLRFLGFLGVVLVHGMCEPHSVARFRYAHVEGCFLNQRLASTRTPSALLRSAERLASIRSSRRWRRLITRLVVTVPTRLLP